MLIGMNGQIDQLPTEVKCGCGSAGELPVNMCTEINPLYFGSHVCSPGTNGSLPMPGPNVVYSPGSVRVGNACP